MGFSVSNMQASFRRMEKLLTMNVKNLQFEENDIHRPNSDFLLSNSWRKKKAEIPIILIITMNHTVPSL